MPRKVHILQGANNEVVAVESSLKKLINSKSDELQLLSYGHMHRLVKAAKEENKSMIAFDAKSGESYKLSWWDI